MRNCIQRNLLCSMIIWIIEIERCVINCYSLYFGCVNGGGLLVLVGWQQLDVFLDTLTTEDCSPSMIVEQIRSLQKVLELLHNILQACTVEALYCGHLGT